MGPYDVDLVVVGRDDEHVAERLGARHVAGESQLNPAEARNLGVRSTKADRLIFLDSDCIPQPGWLDAMLSNLDNEDVVVSGSIIVVPDHYIRLAGNIAAFQNIPRLIRRPTGTISVIFAWITSSRDR